MIVVCYFAETGEGQDMSSERFFISDALVLDREDGAARLDGQPLRLGVKAIAVLEALMSQPGRLLSKEKLFELAWPDQAVSDSVLTTAIKELRQALHDNARQPEWIATEHGRGYRFLKDVVPSATDPGFKLTPPPTSGSVEPADKKRRRWPLVITALALVGLAVFAILRFQPDDRVPANDAEGAVLAKAVVVLPFEAHGEDDATRLASVLNEEIVTALTRTPDIHVAGPSIVNRVLESGSGGDEEGKAAGFTHILHGTVREDDDRIRVTVRLTSTETGREIWSNRFDHSTEDIIALQEDVAFQIARALNSVMDPKRLRAMTQIGTRSVEAYQAYRKGKDLVANAVTTSNPKLMDEGYESYQKALSFDPNFARAYWESANLELMTANTIYVEPDSWVWSGNARNRYIEHVEAAIETSPDEVDRTLYTAARELADLRYLESVRLLRRYLEDRPNDMDGWHSLLEQARIAGRYDLVNQAIEQLIILGQRAGFYPVIGSNYMDHNPELALRFARESMEVAPDFTALQFQAHRAFLIAERPDEARALLERMQAGRLPEPVRVGAQIRQLCADGETEEARALAQQLLDNEDMPIVVRWSSALTAGLDAEAYELLLPLDRPENLLPLAKFLMYSEFDSTRFPELSAALARAGIEREPARLPVYACQ